jgi:hypothetical protein
VLFLDYLYEYQILMIVMIVSGLNLKFRDLVPMAMFGVVVNGVLN